jgi:hypothetical protein
MATNGRYMAPLGASFPQLQTTPYSAGPLTFSEGLHRATDAGSCTTGQLTFGAIPLSDPCSPKKTKQGSSTWNQYQVVDEDPLQFEAQYLEQSPVYGKKNLPWLEDDVVAKRYTQFGLNEKVIADFIKESEFVSMGCFCVVTRALQCLGIKRYTYPFDWVRTNVPCTVKCLKTDFAGFCTSSFVGAEPSPGVICHGGAKWGGSFWHHDPANPKVQKDFQRRIERLAGKNEVAEEVRRVFCVNLNALTDMTEVLELRFLLETMLPSSEIFLLVFIDNQRSSGLVRVDGDSNMLFYLTGEAMFEDMGSGGRWAEQKHSEEYAAGLAAAVTVWSDGSRKGSIRIREVSSCTELFRLCSNFDGGDPASNLYWPLRAAPVAAPPIIEKQSRCKRKVALTENTFQPSALSTAAPSQRTLSAVGEFPKSVSSSTAAAPQPMLSVIDNFPTSMGSVATPLSGDQVPKYAGSFSADYGQVIAPFASVPLPPSYNRQLVPSQPHGSIVNMPARVAAIASPPPQFPMTASLDAQGLMRTYAQGPMRLDSATVL